MKTLITSDPTECIQRFPKKDQEIPMPEKWTQEFESFDQLVDFGQKNSENKILTIETLRKDGRTRETFEFINFKP